MANFKVEHFRDKTKEKVNGKYPVMRKELPEGSGNFYNGKIVYDASISSSDLAYIKDKALQDGLYLVHRKANSSNPTQKWQREDWIEAFAKFDPKYGEELKHLFDDTTVKWTTALKDFKENHPEEALKIVYGYDEKLYKKKKDEYDKKKSKKTTTKVKEES